MAKSPSYEAARLLGSLASQKVSLAPLCTYRVGGAADVYVEVNSLADVEKVQKAVEHTGVPTLVVGRGSNLLVADKGFSGVVVQLGSSFGSVDANVSDGILRCGGGALMPVAARQSAAAGLTGFEWAVGVPGSIGGGVRMNAGGHGSDMAATLTSVVLFDLVKGGPVTVSVSELALGYRESNIERNQIVLSADFQLEQGDTQKSLDDVSEIVRWRRKNQPGGQNAGSVFRNPEGDSAGRIVESVGLKGFRIGSAEVSAKHANFIQADRDGSADDVFAVIQAVQQRVFNETGVLFHPENHLIGFETEG